MDTTIATPLSPEAKRVLLLGSGELGKEVAIELQRLGVEVIACDRYPDAPAMQVAHRAHIFSMLDGPRLREVVEVERPALIVPEIEAIATDTLEALEREGWNVVPTARAARLTMDREGIRRLAAETLGLPTSPYRFVDTLDACAQAVREVGLPCVLKPVMSSSGKGQSTMRSMADVEPAWNYAQAGGRAGAGRCIVEGFVPFDYEITLLTVRSVSGTRFCAPIGHMQVDGDYRESWQPQPMSDAALAHAQEIAASVTANLGGYGIFGVELFVRGDDVLFSEVSPRPHDTGLVTLISQDLSEFALHARAILGLPIPGIRSYGPAASRALVFEGDAVAPRFGGLDDALAVPDVHLRLFGKPELGGGRRRMGVTLALGDDIETARARARRAGDSIHMVPHT